MDKSPLQRSEMPEKRVQTELTTSQRRLVLTRRGICVTVAVFLLALNQYLPTYFNFSNLVNNTEDGVRTADIAWQDNVWPIRNQTFWDISTSYPYPRTISFDVNEGTWLRLDVHPVTEDIVFDMIGDIYCLPAEEYKAAQRNSAKATTALPVLLGVPYDTDPHFSPDGTRLAFRSDAGLGVENIWIMPWNGCTSAGIRSDTQDIDLAAALSKKDDEDALLVSGVPETEERRTNRLRREGRLNAQRVTNETYRYLSDPRFHPSGEKIIATKWYTSSRSLGAGEGWEYPLPAPGDNATIPVASGKRIVERTLPPGWDEATQYGDQQIGPEQSIWYGNDTVIYSKNVIDASTFQYSKDVHKGIYSIFAKNLTTGETTTIVSSSPGGASRPELSSDGKTLAFVRRSRDKEFLVLRDMETGTLNSVFDGLSYDLSIVAAPMGTYPSFAFTPTDNAVIIWAAGQIHRIPLSINPRGERVTSLTEEPSTIPFTAHIEKRLANVVSGPPGGFNVLWSETQAKERARAFTSLRVDETGARVLFEAAGSTFGKDLGSDAPPLPLATLVDDAPYYSPSFVTGEPDWVIHARWDEASFTPAFELASLDTGESVEIPLPAQDMGRYFSPVLSGATDGGTTRKIAFMKTAGDTMTGSVVATARPGLWIGDIDIDFSSPPATATIENLEFVPSTLNYDDTKFNMRFVPGSTDQLLVNQAQNALLVDLAAPRDITRRANVTEIATARTSTEVAVPLQQAPNQYAAFVDFYQVYVAPSDTSSPPQLWSKPGNATAGLTRVSTIGGHEIAWSDDGKVLFWLAGPNLYSLEVSRLSECQSEIEQDPIKFGIECTKDLFNVTDILVERTTDIERIKQAVGSGDGSDVVVLQNATVLTMESGVEKDDYLPRTSLVVKAGVIQAVGKPADEYEIPAGATVIDVEGAFVVPGFIDVHAHWNGFFDRYPATSWEMETFLAYGVTTLHNPSADNVLGFRERDRVEAGKLIGPRIYTVGGVIYGAAEPSLYLDIEDMDEAYSALIRLKMEGGDASLSYKNYQLPYRSARQRLLTAARNENISMLCVPEGGMTMDWDMTFIIDGMTTVEHALPIPELYDDVINFFALSGTGNTPTHIVNYGGAFGEQFVWGHYDVPNDPKLRRFSRHDILEGVTESTARPKNSWQFFNTSASDAKMVKKGLRAHIGAHGEPPLGLNYHAEMFFTSVGGLSNYEVLRAATSDAAKTLGLFPSLGSVTAGKLADLVIYKPGVALLDEYISSSLEIRYVARGGRFWDAETMEEVWPVKGRKQVLPPFNPE